MITFEQDDEDDSVNITEPDPDGKHCTILTHYYGDQSAYVLNIEAEDNIAMPKNWIIV